MKFSKTELAWQGGIVDGEGTITIQKQIRKNRPSPAFRACVEVTNTDLRIILPFKYVWGGEYYQRPDKRKEKDWKDSYTWHCLESKMAIFLKKMLPYLKAKQDQAKLILEFIKYKKSFKRKSLGRGYGSAPLGQEEINFRQNLYDKIRILNSKGRFSRKQKGGGAI